MKNILSRQRVAGDWGEGLYGLQREYEAGRISRSVQMMMPNIAGLDASGVSTAMPAGSSSPDETSGELTGFPVVELNWSIVFPPSPPKVVTRMFGPETAMPNGFTRPLASAMLPVPPEVVNSPTVPLLKLVT